jgi:hypothetical protein
MSLDVPSCTLYWYVVFFPYFFIRGTCEHRVDVAVILGGAGVSTCYASVSQHTKTRAAIIIIIFPRTVFSYIRVLMSSSESGHLY